MTYDATDDQASATFTLPISKEGRLLGSSNVLLRMSTDAGDDLDAFACVYKVGPDGKSRCTACSREETDVPGTRRERDHPRRSVCVGPGGRLRASHRAIDREKSTGLKRVHPHTSLDPIEPGQIIDLDVGLWPTGLLLHAGEPLVLEVAGFNACPVAEPRASDEQPDLRIENANRGQPHLYTAGEHGSRLILPVVANA